MSYERPYAGMAAQRPSPRPYAPQQYQPPPPQQQQYDQYGYDDGNGYDQYDNGFDQGYGPPQDMGYGRNGGPPNGAYSQQDPYGPGPGRGGPPGPRGRGGPMQRPPTADGPRGGPYPPRGGGGGPGGPGRGMPPPGRGGRPGPLDRSNGPDPRSNRGPPGPPVLSPAERDFGSSYPVFPGHERKTDFQEENNILNKMSNMNMSDRRPGMGPQKSSQESQRSRPSMDEYGGRPSMDSQRGPPPRGYPQQGYPDQRRGPPPPGPGGYGASQSYRDDGYGQSPMSPTRDGGFGPPGRSMTMPNNPMSNGGPGPNRGIPPSRMDNGPYNGPPGRNMPPSRPSTAQGGRPAPQRQYNEAPPGPPFRDDQYGHFDPPPQQGWVDDPAARGSLGDFYDDYYDQPPPQQQHSREQIPDFNAAPNRPARGSLDEHMRPGAPQQPYNGPARTPGLSHAKSQPNLREPQAAVFEMASDLPPVPQGGFNQGYYNDTYGGPGRPPPMGLPAKPGPVRPGYGPGPPQGPPGGNPDALPSHPTPVRPGLMPGSMVSMNDKPAPVRNYTMSSTVSAPAAIPQGPPQQANIPAVPSVRANSITERVPVTLEELERLRALIKQNPNDQQSAIALTKRLMEAADVLVPNLPDPKARARSRERYLADAHKILKKLVNAQNPEAMFILADAVGKGGFGAEPDHKEAFTMYQSAAKLGHAAAAYRTAVCCEIGNEEGGGTRKDPLKAIQWYKRAATLGDTPAMYKLGIILLKGLLGQPKNPRESVGWLKRAAERADAENPHALHELGLLYESAQPNDAILRDEAYAFRLFQQAAELGYKFSQYRLGCAYEYGLMGCPIDPRLSIMWYSRAATQEEHQSELALSGWYLTGSEGVLGQSDTEAYLWARKAAMAGLAKAEYAMGYFTEVGIGVPANLEDAKRWYWRAAAQDFPKARERLEDLKRYGKSGPRQRERISRSKIGKQQEGECSVM